MDSHAIRLLEFPAVLQQLEQGCFSEPGRRALRQQGISTDAAEVRDRLSLAVAFRRLLESGQTLPPLDFPDPGEALARLGKEGIAFEPEELAAFARFISSAGKLARHIRQHAGETPLAEIAGRVPEMDDLAREIFRILDKEGNLREKNIPSLLEIRGQIKGIQKGMEKLVSGYLENPEYRTWWQADLPTQKDGRTVLPLKANFKGRISGIVHDVSSSGATLFLEPADVVEKNNELAEARARYQREVTRLLRELSGRLNAREAELRDLFAGIAELDTFFARAEYAIHHRCNAAEHAPGRLELREARHPLLGPEAVPITAAMDEDQRIMIITGPNTGGKTVTLKTIGLLALMNQFGMEIPAGEGSGLGVFDGVFADIGDEQSIEQSLSTFSGHIVTIAGIVGRCTERSLVLLDELGAGTDPEEGVALAMALLDWLLDRGPLVAVTTHHGILKNYGYSRSGVRNASMEFDKESLRPTFRLIMGVPGESQALEIARRYGIPGELVEKARGYLRDERGDISELIGRLAARERQILRTEQEQSARETLLREQRRETDLKELRLRQREHELRRQEVRDLQRFLAEARSQVAAQLREMKEGRGIQAREIQGLLSGIEERAQREENRLAAEAETLYPETVGEIRPGLEVLIGETGRRGRVVRRDRGNAWVVETETMRLTLTPREMRPATARGRGRELTISHEVIESHPSFELDLRGMRLEEALQRLERQIDQSLMSGLSEFHVIHGKGEGILQRGIHEYLRNSRSVREYSFASPEEGGFGKTIVRL